MDDGIDLSRWLSTIRRRRYTVGIVTLAFLVAGALSGFLRPPYESRALIQLSRHSAPAYATPPSAAQVLMSLSFLEAVARTASLPVTGRELYGIVKAAPIRDTQMLHLSVRYKSAGEARDLASAIARAFISKASEGVQQRRDLIRVHLEAVDAQLALIQRIQQSNWAKLDQQQQGATIRGEEGAVNRALTLNTLRVSETLFKELRKDLTAELSTLEPPVLIEPPFIPAQSKNLRIFADMVLAAVLGLLAGSALAFFIDDFRSLRPAPIQTRLAEATSDPRRSKELGG